MCCGSAESVEGEMRREEYFNGVAKEEGVKEKMVNKPVASLSQFATRLNQAQRFQPARGRQLEHARRVTYLLT